MTSTAELTLLTADILYAIAHEPRHKAHCALDITFAGCTTPVMLERDSAGRLVAQLHRAQLEALVRRHLKQLTSSFFPDDMRDWLLAQIVEGNQAMARDGYRCGCLQQLAVTREDDQSGSLWIWHPFRLEAMPAQAQLTGRGRSELRLRIPTALEHDIMQRLSDHICKLVPFLMR